MRLPEERLPLKIKKKDTQKSNKNQSRTWQTGDLYQPWVWGSPRACFQSLHRSKTYSPVARTQGTQNKVREIWAEKRWFLQVYSHRSAWKWVWISRSLPWTYFSREDNSDFWIWRTPGKRTCRAGNYKIRSLACGPDQAHDPIRFPVFGRPWWDAPGRNAGRCYGIARAPGWTFGTGILRRWIGLAAICGGVFPG